MIFHRYCCSIVERVKPSRALLQRSPSEGQKLVRVSIAQKALYCLLAVFLVILTLDIYAGEAVSNGLICEVAGVTEKLKCSYDQNPPHKWALFGIELFSGQIFGKSVDITITLAVISILYTIHHASQGSKPYVTYNCYKEVTESGVRWVAHLRNDGLGPAINPVSMYWLEHGQQEVDARNAKWIDSREIKRVLKSLISPHQVEIISIGSGGVFSKDKELKIFSCSLEALEKIDCLELLFTYRGHYGALYERRVVIIPPKDQRE